MGTFSFIIQLVLEIADFIADWLFAFDVHYLESGLVYGRHNDAVKFSILILAVLGTVTLLVETVCSCKALCDKPCCDPFKVSVVILWIEDIPQAIISLVIATCREDGSSRFQLAKAGIAFFLSFVQLIFVAVECHQQGKKSKENSETNFENSGGSEYSKEFPKCAVFFIFIGVICNIAACISVFILSYSQVQGDGLLFIREPTTDFEERYDDGYFVNVSVYIYDPSFQSNHENDTLWMKLTPINSLRESGENKMVAFQYRYQVSPSELRFALWSNVGGQSAPWECYTLNKRNHSIEAMSNCTSSFLQGDVRGLSVQLVFKPPESVAHIFKKTIYGDIFFGVAIWDHERCNPLTQFQNIRPTNVFHAYPAVHYFRSSESSGNCSHLMEVSEKLRFYKMAELTYVASIWRTGWTKCSATGHLAPQLDADLTVQC